MNSKEIKRAIREDSYQELISRLYPDVTVATERIISLVDKFVLRFGERDMIVVSAPGRTEICGNHTDHNGGVVIGASIDRDIIAVAARRDDDIITVQSVGRREDKMTLGDTTTPDNFPDGRSASLIAGVVDGFRKRGFSVGGFDCYTTSDVPAGSGLSSSAAFEGVIGAVVNHLFLDGKVPPFEVAKIGQYAENVYYRKPSGLLDQMSSAIGGYVYIDFSDRDNPVFNSIEFSPLEFGYTLVVVATGGSHADLGDAYAAIPDEMRSVAALFGKERLSEVERDAVMNGIRGIRSALGDRAFLRAMHFYFECERVENMREALEVGDLSSVLEIMKASGHSSFEYLQNVYPINAPKEQGLPLALMLTEDFLMGDGAYRVHGGGFQGTIQALIPTERVEEYRTLIDGVFGDGAVMVLNVRPIGQTRII